MHSEQSYPNIFILILFLLFALPFGVSAQAPPTQNPFIFEIIPTYPRPGDTVTIRVQSFSIDLNRASITWTINGRVESKGTAKQEISFVVGALGSQTFVNISAFVDGQFFSDQLTIRPSDIDILWEGNTYTAPFYKGKALLSARAPVSIVALPKINNVFGGRVRNQDLIFTWEENGRVLGNSSGRGRNTLQIVGPRLFNTTNIAVTVATLDNSTIAKRLLSLSAIDPLIVFYENSLLYGTQFNKAIHSTFRLQNEEITVTAHPFYIASNEKEDNDIEYNWVVNGQTVVPDGDKSSLVLRQTGSGEGSATISLTVRHLRELIQQAQNSFTILFSRTAGGAFDF